MAWGIDSRTLRVHSFIMLHTTYKEGGIGDFFCLFLLKMGVPNYDLRFAFLLLFLPQYTTTTGSRWSGWKKKFLGNLNPDNCD